VNVYERWLFELWHGDYAVADDLIAEGFVGHWPDREVQGRDALVALIRETRDRFASLTFTLEVGPFGDDIIAARWAGEATEPAMRLFGHDLLRIRDGRIAEYWVVSWSSG
jgi:ketosteroid isomerase-like protein